MTARQEVFHTLKSLEHVARALGFKRYDLSKMAIKLDVRAGYVGLHQLLHISVFWGRKARS